MKSLPPKTLVILCMFVCALVFLVISTPVHAQVTLAKLFGDNMVLQRNKPINIWGSANANQEITVTLNNHQVTNKADQNGDWVVTLPPQTMATNQTITIAGGNIIRLTNIAFGDVYLAGGQSNMAYRLKQVISMFPDEVKLTSYPDVRHFKVARKFNFKGPQQDIPKAQWQMASQDTVGNFSAVAWFFAKTLSQHQQVPIGIISSNVGSSPVESWMSKGSFSNYPKTLEFIEQLGSDDFISQLKYQFKLERQTWQKNNPNKKLPFKIKRQTMLDFEPTGFYNAMIAPLEKLKFAGVIWYQGEGNTAAPESYADKFSTMIAQWRTLFNQPELPFMFVQLANFLKPDSMPSESNWAELRAQQTKVSQTVANTAMALAIDVGEQHDIHPKDKKTVGERLALAARHLVYGETDIVFLSPLLKNASAANDKALLHFELADSTLTQHGDKLLGFAIAGDDKQFIWANAQLIKNTVTVWHPSISSPRYVRYAWGDNPNQANLYNQQGLPATPFSIELE